MLTLSANKQVRGDLIKAEEYCGRAMLARGNNGSVISMYADLIWSNYMDASRAESYHLQATKTSPDNRYEKTKSNIITQSEHI